MSAAQRRRAAYRYRRRASMFTSVVMSIGLALTLIGAVGAWRGIVTRSWPTTEATLVHNDLTSREVTVLSPAGQKPHATPEDKVQLEALSVTYRYRVDGVTFEGHKLEPWDFGFAGPAKSRQVAALGAGAKHFVSYDPSDPRRAYLKPGPSTAALSFLILGGVMLAVGFAVGRLQRSP